MLEWVDWFNHRRLLEPIGDISSRRSWNRRIISNGKSQPWWPDSNKRVSGIPGAVHIVASPLRGALKLIQPNHRLNRLISSVKTTLIITMDVMGMNTIPRSVSMRKSPGKRPNQLKAQGANCSIAPTTSSTAPAIMIHFAMLSVPVRYSIPSKIINHHELVGTSRLGSRCASMNDTITSVCG